MDAASRLPAGPEGALVEAAQGRDERAFHRIVEPYRQELHAHCYRMLGSVQDTEDALQEALLRAWRALPGFGGERLVRPWLYKIATNVCLDALGRRPPRLLPIDFGPPLRSGDDPGEPLDARVWVEPYPDEQLGDGYASPEARYEQREAVELAFIVALQHLPPRQRAVLILREVLGFSTKEVAEALETTVASVNSALQRARKTVDERLPSRSQQATARSLGDERVGAIVQSLIDAFERGDADTILGLLAEDATFAVPPYASWCRGRKELAESWLMPGKPGGLRCLPARANGQLAVAVYLVDPPTGRYLPLVLDVLALRDERIAEITAFRTPEVFRRFGLPDAV